MENWCMVLLIKKVMEKNLKSTETVDPDFFLKKRKFRIDTQIAIKIQYQIASEGTSYLRAFEASGSCFRRNTCHPEVNSYISPKAVHTILIRIKEINF